MAASAPAGAQEPALDAVASFSILGDMAARVGGDRVAIDVLVGPDEDSHVYEPNPADAARLAATDLVPANGLGFEGFLDRLVEASETDATIVVLGDAIEPLAAGEEDYHRGHGDEAHEGRPRDAGPCPRHPRGA